MSEPIFNDMAEDIYTNLPEHFRRMDPGQDYHFKKLIAAFTPVVDQIEKMAESFDYTPPQDGGDPNDPNNTSALVDPSKADPRYFPWLAQIYGVRLNSELGYEEQRQQLVNAAIGYRAGTPEAIEAAARTFLRGDKYARVYGHSTAAGVGEGGPWDLLLVTKSSETLKNLFPESLNIAANIGAVTSQDMTFYRRNEVFNPSFETNDLNWSVLGALTTKTRLSVDILPANRPTPVPNSKFYLNVHAQGGTDSAGVRGTFSCAATPTLVARRTNLYTDPSFSTLTGKTVGPGVAWSLATSWADSGTTSIRLTPSIIGGTNPNTYINIFPNENTLNGLVPGKTYTISATINLSQVQGGTLSDNARRIAVFSGTGSPAPLIATSEQAPNALGPNRVSCTFTVPVGATRAYVYLYNGSYRTSDVAYWDSLLLEETSEVRPYFDGSTAYEESTESNYTWTGAVNGSTSVEVLGNVMMYSAWVYVHSADDLFRNITLRVTDHESTVYTSSPANKVGWQRLSLKCPLPITSGTIQHDIVCLTAGSAGPGIDFGVDGVMVEQYTRYLYSYFDSRTDPVSAPYKTSYLGGDNLTSWQAIQLSARLITDPDVYAGRAYKIGTDYPLEIDLDLIKARAASAPGGVNVTMPWIIGSPGFLSFAAKMPRVINIDETSHQIMFKARTAGASIPLKIGVKWYNNSGSPINDTAPEIINAGTLTGEWQQFNLWTASPPAGADQVGIWLYYDLLNMPPTLDYTEWQMFFAETGLRTDPETEWTPVNADPGQIVARLGAKPAGYKLHYAQLVATWDTVESVFPTWSLLDGNTWRDIDESGVQPPP